MGGALAQIVALRHPARVTSLAAISTTRADRTDPDLPGPTAEYMEHAGSAEELDWSDERAVAAFLVEDSRALSGTSSARGRLGSDRRGPGGPQCAGLAVMAARAGGSGTKGVLFRCEMCLTPLGGGARAMPYRGSANGSVYWSESRPPGRSRTMSASDSSGRPKRALTA